MTLLLLFLTWKERYSRLKIHETSEVRDLDLVVANEAIEHIKDFFPSLVGSRPSEQFKSSLGPRTQQTALVEVDSETPSSQPQLLAAKSLHPSSEHAKEQRIWEIFKDRDGRLVQEIIDLKASHKKDYVIRLASLYLYAKELKGEEIVLREEVVKILEDANVKDSNTSTNIHSARIRLEENGTLHLTLDARTRAQQYIAEILNPDAPDGWRPGLPTRSTNSRAKKQAKRGNERHNESDELVAEWVSCEKTQELNEKFPQSITGRFPVEDKALFGLYCLDKVGINTEVQPIQLSKYLYRAFQLNVQADSIRFKKALSNKPPYTSSLKGAGYRITPSGIDYVEQLLELSK